MMAMKSAPFCLTCAVADVLVCFTEVKAEIVIIQRIGPLSYGSSVVMKKITDFSRVLKCRRPGYGARSLFFWFCFSTSSLKIMKAIHRIILFKNV